LLLGRGFIERYNELSEEKDSFLCVGVDPVTAEMRGRYVIPPRLVEERGLREGIKAFCVDLVEAVSPYTPIIKPNAQFITYALSLDDLREMTEAIHDGGCLALLDTKLTDIGSTNAAGLHWIGAAGFDAVTFSPFPGYEDGTDVLYKWSEEREKGIFALCRMSNPGGEDYQSRMVEGEPLYVRLARDARGHGCNGYVVGCTVPEELGQVRAVIGEERLILAPGLGPQGGDPAAALRMGTDSAGGGLIVSSSRSIDYAYETLGWGWERFAEAAAAQAERKRDELNELRRKVLS
jgi:orotidine-5'-phosphate decarboxylase